MSKTTTFVCNICGTRYETSFRYIVGIRFDSQDNIRESSPYDAENHICKSCLAGLFELSKKAVEEREASA